MTGASKTEPRSDRRLDHVYVAASSRDARFTRICVASVRYFYPSISIRLLAGGALEPGLESELGRAWSVGRADIPSGDWGWGFVKLEPLFGQPGERFLVLDSDTALAGPVLGAWEASTAAFVVDDEVMEEPDSTRLYYDWTKVAKVAPETRRPRFLFNSGQWFGTAGLIRRETLAPLVDWNCMPPRLRHRELFMEGDQGVFNWLLNLEAHTGRVEVDRRRIMRWPGHGLEGCSAKAIVGGTAPPLIIHWAGMKRTRLRTMPGADVLEFFERFYYSRVRQGPARRMLRAARQPIVEMGRKLTAKATRLVRAPQRK